jgi:hypothetical protein
MQQERSFLRRLCFLKIDIYEPKFNARRAYCSIPLAVKTSRPLFKSNVKCQKLSHKDTFGNSEMQIANDKLNLKEGRSRMQKQKAGVYQTKLALARPDQLETT